MSKSRGWVFTINFSEREPTADDLPEHWDREGVRFLCYQFEHGECLHIQGFIYFKNEKSLSTLKKVDDRAHWEACKDIESAIAYCHKPCSSDCLHDFCKEEREKPTAIPDTYFQIGEVPEKGKRTDLEAIKEELKKGLSIVELYDRYPGHMVRYGSNILKMKEVFDSERSKIVKRQKMVNQDIQLCIWQKGVIDRLEKQDDRHILWVWDEGHTGKSSIIGGWLMANKDSLFQFTKPSGQVSDLVYAYQGESYVHIDLPRHTKMETVPFTFFEGLKDGQIFSAKYFSGIKRFEPPKVLVTSNLELPVGWEAWDRYEVIKGKKWVKDFGCVAEVIYPPIVSNGMEVDDE